MNVLKVIALIIGTILVLFGCVQVADHLLHKKQERREQESNYQMTSIYKLKRIQAQPAHWWAK